MEKIVDYFNDVRKEIKKVSWPSQQELVDYTIIVIVFTILLAGFIFVIDRVYSTILEFIYQ